MFLEPSTKWRKDKDREQEKKLENKIVTKYDWSKFL